MAKHRRTHPAHYKVDGAAAGRTAVRASKRALAEQAARRGRARAGGEPLLGEGPAELPHRERAAEPGPGRTPAAASPGYGATLARVTEGIRVVARPVFRAVVYPQLVLRLAHAAVDRVRYAIRAALTFS